MVVRVLDLFSGSGSLAKALSHWPGVFRVTQVELDPDYAVHAIMDPPEALERHVVADAVRWCPESAGPFDVVWASPPCRTYSCLQYRWRDSHARELLMQTEGDPLVKRALSVIQEVKPAVWFLENPMGGQLSKRAFMQGIPHTDVSYCHYGTKRAPWPYRKNTRIWTNLEGWQGRTCRNDCQAVKQGRHVNSLIHIRHNVRGQVPPALIRALFSAACVQLSTMGKAPVPDKTSELLTALKGALTAGGIDEQTADVALQQVDHIQAPQKVPKRTDLLIRIGSKRCRSISAAAATLLEMFPVTPDEEEEDEAQETKDSAEESPELLDSKTLNTPEVFTSATSDSKEVHFHFHISLPSMS